MVGPTIAGIVFSLLVIALSLIRPNAGRIFLGIFFVAMGLGVNLVFLLTDPQYVVAYGQGAWLPAYRTLTNSVVALNPAGFVILLILFEVFMGLCLLSKGTWVKAGLIGTMVFVVALVPLYYSQIAWAVSVVGNAYLLTKNFDTSIVGMIRRRRKGVNP